MYVLNTVLGGSMSSRLFQNVRERHGLVYSISSGVTAYSDAGALTIYAGTSLESVDEVIRLTIEELKRLRGERMADEELRRAKDHLKGSLMLSLENTGSRMSHLARQEIYFGRRFTLDEIMAGIESVTHEDVVRVADAIFAGELTGSILGNLGKYRVPRQLLKLSA
jgi:predicted Zn-dependent peptidase